jgi:PhoH-like ATPase
MKKIFVLDTNIILDDAHCAYNFEENEVVVPMVVIEELDRFKKGSRPINANAREFIRLLDSFDAEALFSCGVLVGSGTLRVQQCTHERDADTTILHLCALLRETQRPSEVVLVTKDVNLRLRARAAGTTAEGYASHGARSDREAYTGHVSAEVPPFLVDYLWVCKAIEAPDEANWFTNQFITLKSGLSKSALAQYKSTDGFARIVKPKSVCEIKPHSAEQIFAIHALTDPTTPLVTIGGKAGTGKTLLALAAALEQRHDFRQIMLARPIVPLSNKDLGFLPGDIQSKVGPYMQPLFDNLSVIRHQFSENSAMQQRIDGLLEERKLLIEPLAYIRGRSLNKMYVIVDEAQNLTPHEVKTIITRAGEGTKVVFTGDVHQIDHPYLDSQSNGLSYLIRKMRGQSLFAHITLRKGERSALSMLASEVL